VVTPDDVTLKQDITDFEIHTVLEQQNTKTHIEDGLGCTKCVHVSESSESNKEHHLDMSKGTLSDMSEGTLALVPVVKAQTRTKNMIQICQRVLFRICQRVLWL